MERPQVVPISHLIQSIQTWAATNPALAVVSAISILAALYHIISRPDSRSPPWVPYWIPWLGSAIAMGQDPDEFFREASKKLGPVFRVKAAGRNMTFVTSPALVAAIYRDSKTFVFRPIRLKISVDVFQVPPHVMYSDEYADNYAPNHHRVLSSKGVANVLQRYATLVFDQVSTRVNELDGASTPLVKLLIVPAYVSAAKAFFGEGFPAAETYDDFATFNDSFHLIVGGIPNFFVKKQRVAWKRVVDVIEVHLGNLRKSGEKIPELVDITFESGEREGWNDRIHAEMIAADLWAMQANAVWAAYWFVVSLLQHPSEYKRVAAEVDAIRAEWTSTHPNLPITSSTFPQFLAEYGDKVPLIASGITETLRLYTSNFSIRRVTTPTEFGGYQFNVGDEIVCNTRSIHMDEEIHEKPYDFVLDRFLDGSKKRTKNGTSVPNHTIPWGGGVSICEGRHFAQGEIKAFVVALLLHSSVEVDVESDRWPEPTLEKVGSGVFGPKGDVNVIIRKHKLWPSP